LFSTEKGRQKRKSPLGDLGVLRQKRKSPLGDLGVLKQKRKSPLGDLGVFKQSSNSPSADLGVQIQNLNINFNLTQLNNEKRNNRYIKQSIRNKLNNQGI